MFNFLFSLICAACTLFGIFLSWHGLSTGTFEAVTAGGVFLFGSLVTFGVGQIQRAMVHREREPARKAAKSRPEPRREPVAEALLRRPEPRSEPEVFPSALRPEPVIPHPALEKVASRFARPERKAAGM